jgi:hypothetical protein
MNIPLPPPKTSEAAPKRGLAASVLCLPYEEEAAVREAMNHYYARDAQSLEQLIRRLVTQK